MTLNLLDILENFPHVIPGSPEFVTRKYSRVLKRVPSEITYSRYDGKILHKVPTEYVYVETYNSFGEIEVVKFWAYQHPGTFTTPRCTRYCYSVIEKTEASKLIKEANAKVA